MDDQNEYDRGWRASGNSESVAVELIYPRSDGHPKFIRVDLECVRANDGLRLWYDFDRDGWVIEQPTDIDADKWREVAFCVAWRFADEPEGEEG